jgi:hypothetical protein
MKPRTLEGSTPGAAELPAARGIGARPSSLEASIAGQNVPTVPGSSDDHAKKIQQAA